MRAVSEFIGRASELAVLEKLRHALAHSRGSVVLIGGERGIGKSRLLEQFLRAAKSGRGRNVIVRQCHPHVSDAHAPVDGLSPADLLSAAHKRATIVAVDDLQWADPSTLHSLQSLLSNAERS